MRKATITDDGWIRFGKEIDDVEIINESTGEWEFPFLSEGDGLSMSGGTGHHSGGVQHGCQGFAYMIDNEWDTNPAKWRFRKEMYHVKYFDDPQFKTWTHPAVNFQIAGHGWFGQKWIRYNKKDGRAPGKDSVVLEVWVCVDPVNNIDDWVMLKRREDKGGWGSGAKSCGAVDDDQVFTWSGIQFRFKSAASDFSLHPRYPETNDSPVVHCIDKEDNDFSENVTRGYCYKKDVPRDIEMTCLYKKDSATNGLCRFKNISLREIDPTKSSDEDPNQPTDPNEEAEVTGLLVLKYDSGLRRDSACAPGGSAVLYESPMDAAQNSWPLGADTGDGITRTRAGILFHSDSGYLPGKPIVECDFYLRKQGSPTGTLSVKIRSGTHGTKATIGTLDVSTLTTSFLLYPFINLANGYVHQANNYVSVEWSGGDSSNYVRLAKRNTLFATGGGTEAFWYDGTPGDYLDLLHVIEGREIPGKLWINS